MSYQEWRRQIWGPALESTGFWAIIDFNWEPAEQNRLAREWKEGSVT